MDRKEHINGPAGKYQKKGGKWRRRALNSSKSFKTFKSKRNKLTMLFSNLWLYYNNLNFSYLILYSMNTINCSINYLNLIKINKNQEYKINQSY